MQKSLQLFGLVICASALAACSHPPQKLSKQTINLNHIDSITIINANKVNVEKSNKEQLSLYSYPDDNPVSYNKAHTAITIEDPVSNITIASKELHTLNLNHVKQVSTSQEIKIGNLNLSHGTHFSSHSMHLKHLSINDNSTVFINYLGSQKLTVILNGHANLTAAGRVNVLQLLANDDSRFLGKRLSSHRAFVKAFDNAFVQVGVRNTLFSYNTPNAVIEYYGNPKVFRRALNSSATLPMSKGVY